MDAATPDTSKTAAPPALVLFGTRRFLPLFVLFQTGSFNDNAIKQSLIWLVTFGGVVFLPGLDPSIRVPVAAFTFTAPFLLVCAVAGQIADKVDRATVFRWVKRAELGIVALAVAGILLDVFALLMVALALMGAQSAFFSPTKNAVLPQYLTPRELIPGNALLSGFGFVFILVGQVAGLQLMGAEGTRAAFAAALGALAVVGWLAAEALPPAAAPSPELKVDYNPVTAIIDVVREAVAIPPVLRPMLGIAWFYALSTVLVTVLPGYVSDVLRYQVAILIACLVGSVLGILVGSLVCAVLGNLRLWGPEAVRLSTLGMGVVLVFSTDLFLSAPDSAAATLDARADLAAFFADAEGRRMFADIVAASIGSGLFVVPLQAMAQRRSPPALRARLMSAGAVLLNLAVNLVTVALILIGLAALPPKAPFLIIVVGAVPVLVYGLYRSFINPTRMDAAVEPAST